MNKGFTLIETLVAIMILVIGVIGPLSLAVRGISDGYYARNQLVAGFLAQESLETVRNIRDSNLLEARATGSTVDSFAGLNDGWHSVNPYNRSIDSGCSTTSDNDCVIRYRPNSNRYVSDSEFSSGQEGPGFYRRVNLTRIDNNPGEDDDELKVEAEVSWYNGINPKQLKLVEYLYRQQDSIP